MIARIARSAAASSRILIARATSSCNSIGGRVRVVGHHAVVCAAGQHLGDHAVQRPEHLVAAGLEHGLVEDLVGQQIRLEVARPSVHHHVRYGGRHDPALMGIGPARGQCRGGRFESAPQLRQREQLGGPVARVEPPPNQPGSKTFHLSAGWMVMPTRRRDSTMPIDSSTRTGLADDAARHTVLCADPVERDHLAGGVVPGHDRGAQRREQTAVQSTDVWLRDHPYILS